MGLIIGLIASILCAVIYMNMCKREQPLPMEKKKEVLPVVFGIAAPVLATVAVILLVVAVSRITNGAVHELPVILRSLISSFVMAGFPEELIKLLLVLLAIRIIKPKNVYEYVILGAGIGFGFTGLEDALYGSGSVVAALSRIPTFALHMAFGVIMGQHLGLAKYVRKNNTGNSGKHVLLALLLPVFWHTLYDAATASNLALQAESEDMQLAGILVALIIVAASVIMQFITLGRCKKKCEEYCRMTTGTDVPETSGGN